MKFKDELQKELYYRSQIDFAYWMLTEIVESKQSIAPKISSIDKLIDKCCWIEEDKHQENLIKAKELLSLMIRCKKKLNIDTMEDKKALDAVKKLIFNKKFDLC